MDLLRLSLLFALTALAEIVGCYLPWLVLRQGKPWLLLLPAGAGMGPAPQSSPPPHVVIGRPSTPTLRTAVDDE